MHAVARICIPILAFAALGAFSSAPDPERGRVIAFGGGAEDPQACFRCHGLNGEGDEAGSVPGLAGQSAYYLAKQLRDFARGTRPDSVMGPIADGMSGQDKQDVAAYYAAMPARKKRSAEPAAHVAALGFRIATMGVPGRGLPACVDCHGASGRSLAPAIPSLAGMQARYHAAQLHRWRRGERNNDPLNGMALLSRLLEPAEIEAVALWFSIQPTGSPP